MGSHSVEPPSAPLTRRRLREAERTIDPTTEARPLLSTTDRIRHSPVSVRSGSTPAVAPRSVATSSAGDGSTSGAGPDGAQPPPSQVTRYVSRPSAEPAVATPVRPMVAQPAPGPAGRPSGRSHGPPTSRRAARLGGGVLGDVDRRSRCARGRRRPRAVVGPAPSSARRLPRRPRARLRRRRRARRPRCPRLAATRGRRSPPQSPQRRRCAVHGRGRSRRSRPPCCRTGWPRAPTTAPMLPSQSLVEPTAARPDQRPDHARGGRADGRGRHHRGRPGPTPPRSLQPTASR